jgi:hypothetical protein
MTLHGWLIGELGCCIHRKYREVGHIERQHWAESSCFGELGSVKLWDELGRIEMPHRQEARLGRGLGEWRQEGRKLELTTWLYSMIGQKLGLANWKALLKDRKGGSCMERMKNLAMRWPIENHCNWWGIRTGANRDGTWGSWQGWANGDTRRRNPIGFLPEVYGVHYRLLSPCVGSFTCPGIDAQVQRTTVFILIWQTLFVFTTYSQVLGGSYSRWDGRMEKVQHWEEAGLNELD